MIINHCLNKVYRNLIRKFNSALYEYRRHIEYVKMICTNFLKIITLLAMGLVWSIWRLLLRFFEKSSFSLIFPLYKMSRKRWGRKWVKKVGEPRLFLNFMSGHSKWSPAEVRKNLSDGIYFLVELFFSRPKTSWPKILKIENFGRI